MTDGILALGALAAFGTALLLVYGGREHRAMRERVLAQTGRGIGAAPRVTRERSVIARPTGGAGLKTRISAWLGLAPGLLPVRRLPMPVVLLAAGVAGGLMAWAGTLVLEGPVAVLLGAPGAAVALRMAFMWELGRHREEAFRQIPDAVGLMVRAVRAGLPINEAMRSVAREMPDPTRGEFQRMLAETRIGASLDRAIWGIHERTGLREYAFLSVVIGLQAQTGGSLAEALDNIGDIVRKRVAMVAKARALASQARASAAILVALPPFAGAAVQALRPGYLDVLFVDPRGQNMLVVALVMITIGLLVIRTMIRSATSE